MSWHALIELNVAPRGYVILELLLIKSTKMRVSLALLCVAAARAEGVGSALKATLDGVSDTMSSRAKVVQEQLRGGFIATTKTGVVEGVVEGASATFKDLRDTVETRLGKVADAVESVRDIVRGDEDDGKSSAEKKVREEDTVSAPRRTLAALATLASTSIVARTTAAIPRHRVSRKKDDVAPAKEDAPFYYREGRHTTAKGVSSAAVPQRDVYYRAAGAAASLTGEATVAPSDPSALYYRSPGGAATLTGAAEVTETEKPAYYRPADGYPSVMDDSLAALAYYRQGSTSAPVAGFSTDVIEDEYKAGYYRPAGGFEYVPDEGLGELPYWRRPPTTAPVEGISDVPTDVRPEYHRPREGFAVDVDPSLDELAYYRKPPTSAPLVGATVNSTTLEKPTYHRPASGFVSDGEEADVLGGVAYYREPPTSAPVAGATTDEPPVAHSYYREFTGKRPRTPRGVKKTKPQRRVALAAAKAAAVPKERPTLPKGVSAEEAPYKQGAPTYYRPSKEAVPKATYVPVNATAAAQASPSYYRPPDSATPTTPSKGPANVPKYYRKRFSSAGLRK